MVDPITPDSVSIIESNYSHYIIIGCSVGGIVWGSINAWWVSILLHAFRRIKKALNTHLVSNLPSFFLR